MHDGMDEKDSMEVLEILKIIHQDHDLTHVQYWSIAKDLLYTLKRFIDYMEKGEEASP